ncbi:MAG: alpha/beta hydrolase [Gemmatimonadota bacterium]|nr:alpha/beta hydrolase [Gemmatimonadota bacterium]MDH3366736.1 alpha/beta hydrolase [Gemmatimonadota bacterium]MDH3478833.1 alpha/beta hydrolase [Gemmatimonadota bacterium]MDH3569025.1 alpha/beta hydrolase [Gemmatimonadota bacterium]MDH5550140.1 alpha/beta hydrolase [Gemmatimonadota bacterium]
MSNLPRRSAVALVVLLGCGCAGEHDGPATRHVQVGSSTSLEVVDWGGRGIPIVLLAGLGHTAHVFDELAPALTDTYHVMGITRRGFGASSQPDSGYDLATLIDDIRIVMDSLGIERAVLAGHSLGGDEMTRFARAYRDRVAALVYIDAAYDRTSSRDSMAAYVVPSSEIAPPTQNDTESADAYRAFYARVNGVTMPLSEIRAMFRWTPEGRFDGPVTPSWIYGRILGSLEDPDYRGIDAPALAIYATDYPLTELFMDYATRDSATRRAMRAYHAASLRTAARSRDHFRTAMSRGRVVEIPGAGHSLYITHAKQVLEAVRGFLGAMP